MEDINTAGQEGRAHVVGQGEGCLPISLLLLEEAWSSLAQKAKGSTASCGWAWPVGTVALETCSSISKT